MRIWLKNIRESIDKTHEQVAKDAKISRSSYTAIENSLRNPSVGVAKRIADVLGFNWTLFFEEGCSETKHKSKPKKKAG